jgi:hypothetical protein
MAGCTIKHINGFLPNTTTKTFDPIQGLVDFTLDVKPYHTKIIEVLVEFVHIDEISVNINEKLDWVINLLFPGDSCHYWFDSITNTLYKRVYYTTEDFDIVGVKRVTSTSPRLLVGLNSGTNTLLQVDGNVVSSFPSGIGIKVDTGLSSTVHVVSSAISIPPYTQITVTSGVSDILVGSPLAGYVTPIGRFTIKGNYGVLFPFGSSFEVGNSIGNNGFYFTLSTIFNSGANTTDIYVFEKITTNILSGVIQQINPSPYGEWHQVSVILDIVDPTLSITVYPGDYWFVQDPVADVRLYIRNANNTKWDALSVKITGSNPLKTICSIEDIPCEQFGYDELPYDGVLGAPIIFNIIGVSVRLSDHYFSIAGNKTEYFPHAQQFNVLNSGINDGRYTVYVSRYNSSLNRTEILTHQVFETPGSPFGQIEVDNNNPMYDTFTLGFDESNDCNTQEPHINTRVVFAERLEITLTQYGSPIDDNDPDSIITYVYK